MRYSVRYQPRHKNWAVVDTAVAGQVMGVHSTKADAYKHAFAEQERWRRLDPVARHLSRASGDMRWPRSLVVR